jgi:hypothetical protein
MASAPMERSMTSLPCEWSDQNAGRAVRFRQKMKI